MNKIQNYKNKLGLKNYQFINWFPLWRGFKIEGEEYTCTPRYDFAVVIGYFELRKWKWGMKPINLHHK